MYGYAAGSAAATTLTPFTRAESTHQPGGRRPARTCAVAHAAGTSAGSHAQTSVVTIDGASDAAGTLTAVADRSVAVCPGLAAGGGSTGQRGLRHYRRGGCWARKRVRPARPRASGRTQPAAYSGDWYVATRLDWPAIRPDVAGLGCRRCLGLGNRCRRPGHRLRRRRAWISWAPTRCSNREGIGSFDGLGGLGLGAGSGWSGASGTPRLRRSGPGCEYRARRVRLGHFRCRRAGSTPARSGRRVLPARCRCPATALARAPAQPGPPRRGCAASVTFPSLMRTRGDGMQRIGLRTNVLPACPVGPVSGPEMVVARTPIGCAGHSGCAGVRPSWSRRRSRCCSCCCRRSAPSGRGRWLVRR